MDAALGILGIFILGIFLNWYPIVILKIPLPESVTWRFTTTAALQTLTTIVLPYLWAISRLALSPADLGISTRKLGQNFLYGCLLYSLALAAFIHCSADPMIANHAVRNAAPLEAIGMASGMSLIAAGTDLATRGFILLSLARYTHVGFAIAVQNVTWYLGHIPEINMLTGCLGFAGAIGLTLTLGILGDVIALRTRNVVGLAMAHILLNVVLTIYIRQL
jgi:hypothetical protein